MTIGYHMIKNLASGLFLTFFFASCIAQQETQVLLSPERPTATSLIEHHAAAAVAKQIIAHLASMPPRGYISIAQNQVVVSRVIHIGLDENNVIVVRHLFFESNLRGQVLAGLAQTENQNSTIAGSVEYAEYSIPASE